jgi:hypothetical protein
MGENDKKLMPVSDSKVAVTKSRASSLIDIAVSDSLRQVAKKAGDQSLVQSELEQQKLNLKALLRTKLTGWGVRTDQIEKSWESMVGESLGDIVGFLEDMGVSWAPIAFPESEPFRNLQEELDLSGQGLKEIDLSEYPLLKKLNCSNNNLRYLDLSHNCQLLELNCSNNQLINLDLWHLPDITLLDCRNNNLVYLDLTRSHKLVDLDCRNNALAGLNLSKRSEKEAWYFDADVFVFSSNYAGKNPSLWREPEYKEGLDNVFRVLNETSEYSWWGEELESGVPHSEFWKRSVGFRIAEVLVDENGSLNSHNSLDSFHDLHNLRRLKFRFNPKFRDFY